MKSLLLVSVIFVAFFATLYLSGCGAADRLVDGEPKYEMKTDKKGNVYVDKVSGDNLTIDEVGETYSVISVIKNDANSSNPFASEYNEEGKPLQQNGKLLGYMSNRSFYTEIKITIYNKREKIVAEELIGCKKNVAIYLPPGKDYQSWVNGKYIKTFDVMPDIKKGISINDEHYTCYWFAY